jgi:hypothetical protein
MRERGRVRGAWTSNHFEAINPRSAFTPGSQWDSNEGKIAILVFIESFVMVRRNEYRRIAC